jgi:hypothetical protein
MDLSLPFRWNSVQRWEGRLFGNNRGLSPYRCIPRLQAGKPASERTVAQEKGFLNDKKHIHALADANGILPGFSFASERIFTRLWLNLGEKHVAHAWRLIRTLFTKGRVSD